MYGKTAITHAASNSKTWINSSAQTASTSMVTSPQRHRPVVIELYTGSLQENIERIAKQHGWYNVVWDIPNDYQWVGNTRLMADNLQDAFTKVLQGYPVQAVFYQGNHVLLIRPRTLR